MREGWGWLRAHAMASRQGSFRSISPTYAEELDFLSRVEEAERRDNMSGGSDDPTPAYTYSSASVAAAKQTASGQLPKPNRPGPPPGMKVVARTSPQREHRVHDETGGALRAAQQKSERRASGPRGTPRVGGTPRVSGTPRPRGALAAMQRGTPRPQGALTAMQRGTPRPMAPTPIPAGPLMRMQAGQA